MSAIIIPRTLWEVNCSRDGELLWTEHFRNLVTDQGVNDLLLQYFKGAGYNAAWYVGLVNSGNTFDVTDTAAAHAGWTENTNYNGGTRPTLQLGPVGNKTMTNVASKATFQMNGAGGTIAGTFLASSPTKGGTTGILYSEASFSNGSKILLANDVLSVTCTVTGLGS